MFSKAVVKTEIKHDDNVNVMETNEVFKTRLVEYPKITASNLHIQATTNSTDIILCASTFFAKARICEIILPC